MAHLSLLPCMLHSSGGLLLHVFLIMWCPTGPPSPQEAASAGRSDRHVPRFQIRGDVSPRDLRLCLRDGQGLHHRPDQRHGDDHPAGAQVPTGPPSAPAVPPEGLKDLWGNGILAQQKLNSVSYSNLSVTNLSWCLPSGNSWAAHPGKIPPGAHHGRLRDGSLPTFHDG